MCGSWPPRFRRQMSSSRHVGDHRQQLGILAEEVLAHVGAVLGLEVLVLAVDALLHPLAAAGRPCRARAAGPSREPQITLMTFQPAPRKLAFELLDDLAVAAHRAVEALQVAVDDEDQVVELLARRRARSRRAISGSSISPSPQERPDLAVRGVGEAAVLQVLQEARLVDRHQRARGPSTPSGTARSPASARDADRTRGPCRRPPGGSSAAAPRSRRPSRKARA